MPILAHQYSQPIGQEIWPMPFRGSTGERVWANKVPEVFATGVDQCKTDLVFLSCLLGQAVVQVLDPNCPLALVKSFAKNSLTSFINEARVEERVEIGIEPDVTVSVTTAEDQVATILSALSLRVTELASILEVKRPTIYGWMQGAFSPQKDKKEKLNLLFEIAQAWNKASRTPLGKAVRHSQVDGATLLELLSQKEIKRSYVLKCLKALSSSPEVRADSAPSPGSVAAALARHGMEVVPNSHDFIAISGQRFEDDLY
jgi:hypothetical protein